MEKESKVKPDYKLVKLLESQDVNAANFGSFIHFEYPYDKIVVANNSSRSIDVWDGVVYYFLKSIKEHSLDINHIIRWNGEIFIACFSGRSVVAYSIFTLKPKKRFFSAVYSVPTLRLLKLTSDLFLTANADKSLNVVSYSKKEIVRVLQKTDIPKDVRLILSKNRRTCFYVNTEEYLSGSDRVTKLIDYSTNKLIARFLTGVDIVKNMCTFLNNQNIEILVTGGKTINVFNTHLPTEKNRIRILENTKISKGRKLDNQIGHFGFLGPNFNVSTNRSTTCMHELRNSLICVGDSKGSIHVLDVEKDEELFIYNVHEGQMMKDLLVVDATSHSVRFISSCQRNVKVYEIHKLELAPENLLGEIGDLKERIGYLFSEEIIDRDVFKVCSEEICLYEITIELKIWDFEGCNIPRIFFV